MNTKVLLFCLLSLFCTANLFASNSVSVKSGNVSVLKSSSKAILEIDYSATKVGKQTLAEYLKERGDDYVRDWPQESEAAASYFRERFDKKSNGLKLTTDETSASYKIVIHVNALDMGNGGSFFVTFTVGGSRKAGGAIMSGPVEIIDVKTNEVVCTLYADEIKGSADLKIQFVWE